MRPRPSHAVLAMVLLGAVAWGVSYWRSDERRLRARLGELEALIEKEAGENQLVAANRARQLGELLGDGFEIHLTPFSQVLTDPSQLSRAFFQYRSGYRRIGAELDAREVTIDSAARLATMEVIAALTGEGAEGGASRERYRLSFRWLEEGGDWYLGRAELVEVVEGPAIFF